jgi:hypothetical protein
LFLHGKYISLSSPYELSNWCWSKRNWQSEQNLQFRQRTKLLLGTYFYLLRIRKCGWSDSTYIWASVMLCSLVCLPFIWNCFTLRGSMWNICKWNDIWRLKYNMYSFHLVFCRSVSLVRVDATCVSVCSFSVGKVNVLFACELNMLTTENQVKKLWKQFCFIWLMNWWFCLQFSAFVKEVFSEIGIFHY